MKPRILLVYANPAITATPVAPYGAERVAHAFRIAGCDARVIAPWLELRPAAALAAALDAGVVTINGGGDGPGDAPFEPARSSGMGRVYLGPRSLESFTRPYGVSIGGTA